MLLNSAENIEEHGNSAQEIIKSRLISKRCSFYDRIVKKIYRIRQMCGSIQIILIWSL